MFAIRITNKEEGSVSGSWMISRESQDEYVECVESVGGEDFPSY